MCQIHVVKGSSYREKDSPWFKHLRKGADDNPHGFSCLLINEETGYNTLVRAMNWDSVESLMVLDTEWTLAVIHQRYTTQGENRIYNNHLWELGHSYFCHNGILSDPESRSYDVDSQLIGKYFEKGMWEALKFCQTEDYANVILIDMDTEVYAITRSKNGTLYTDHDGQFSSDKFSICDKEVPKNSILLHSFKVNYDEVDFTWVYDDRYGEGNNHWNYAEEKKYWCPACTSSIEMSHVHRLYNPLDNFKCHQCNSSLYYTEEDIYDPWGLMFVDDDAGIPSYESSQNIKDEGSLRKEQVRAIANGDKKEYNRLQKILDAVYSKQTITIYPNEDTLEELQDSLAKADAEIAILIDTKMAATENKDADQIEILDMELKKWIDERDYLEEAIHKSMIEEEKKQA